MSNVMNVDMNLKLNIEQIPFIISLFYTLPHEVKYQYE